MQMRKEDTRKKIMMGGLFVKVGLDHLHDDHKNVLLGILVDAYAKLYSPNKEHYMAHYKKLRDAAFNKKQ